MKRLTILMVAIVCCLLVSSAYAQPKTFNIRGTVMDEKGEELVGATIVIKNLYKLATVSDVNGKFALGKIPDKSTMVVSMLGYKPQEFIIEKDNLKMVIGLAENREEIEEVVVVGHGTQRKASVIGAITSVSPDALNVPAASITNMLGGYVPGIITVTRSGEPGNDFSEFWVRGISTFGANSSALVLVDGVEGNLNDLDAADIESFSILKDASATAVYGVRGANGVVVVNTKRGKSGKLNINFKTNVTLSQSGRMPNYLGAYDYARLANEARVVRGLPERYDQVEMKIIENNLDPDLYPNVDWRDVILKDQSFNTQSFLSVSGGGGVARYYFSVGIQSKDAVFKIDPNINKYNTNINWNKYTFRANIDANLTKTTVMSLGLDGVITKQNSPGFGNDNTALWSSQANMTPLTVPIRYSNGMMAAYGTNGQDISPYVLLNHTGMKRNTANTNKVNFALTQDLDFITEGLSAAALFAYTTNSSLNSRRTYMPDLYKAYGRYNDGSLMFEKTVTATSAAFSRSTESDQKYYFEGRFNYDRSFNDKHRVGGLVHYYMQDFQTSKFSDEIKSIPQRYQALSARLTYSFMDAYFVEGNIGYTGSENFKPGEQFGLFPAIAVGWSPSSYKWVRENLKFINNLKIRATYGEVGNDRISNDQRFPYMTYVNFNNQGAWGSLGLTEGQIGANNLQWEIAKKFNFGVDGTLFKNLSFTIDFFKDVRENIFQQRFLMPGEVGAVTVPYTNVGSMESWGTDGNVTYMCNITKDLHATFRGNFTMSNNKVTHWDESIKNFEYQNKTGRPVNVNRGLIALGLFKDEAEILASPKQTFAEVLPGDIRYKDVNGDGRIDANDVVPLSYSPIPKIQYGFAMALSYKGWNLNILFEGVGKVNYFYGGSGFYPFSGGDTGNILDIVDLPGARWIPASYSGDISTENPNARFPRLSYGANKNNNQNSTFWLADGSYFRLKNVDLSYRLATPGLKKASIQAITFQLVGNNLVVFDKVKLWDPGQASSNGAVYPVQRTYTFQLQVQF